MPLQHFLIRHDPECFTYLVGRGPWALGCRGLAYVYVISKCPLIGNFTEIILQHGYFCTVIPNSIP